MPKEIFPSSYVCDCGFTSHHSENTIRELKHKSLKTKQCLIADDGIHEIIFERGAMVNVNCPEQEKYLGKGKGRK